jgi:hypothetical protein
MKTRATALLSLVITASIVLIACTDGGGGSTSPDASDGGPTVDVVDGDTVLDVHDGDIVGTPDADGVEVDPCAVLAEGDPCDDGNACTAEDACSSGFCLGAVNVSCDGGGVCRDAVCDPAVGCTYTDLTDGTSCTMGCFGASACGAGECVPDADTAVACPQPDVACVNQIGCDPATSECTVMIYEAEGTDCDSDEDACSLETCDGAGACVDHQTAETCADENDGNPCWTYVCSPKDGCIKTNFVEGNSCSDNNPCTYTDLCTENEFGQETCLGTPVQVDDGNPCTDDSCVDGTVMHTPIDGAGCTTNDVCALPGTCNGDTCQSEEDCDCVVDADCAQPVDLCTGTIVCDLSEGAGQCVLEEGSAKVCNDVPGDCTDVTCEPDTGGCVDSSVASETVCVPDDTTCADAGKCDGSGACIPDTECACDVDADCAKPADLCSGVMVCDKSAGAPACVLDEAQAETCSDLIPATPCQGFVCQPGDGDCAAVSWANGTACTPLDTTCSETGTCDKGICEPDAECLTEEAIYIIDGIDSVVRRSFDHGDTWQVMSTAPIPSPSIISMARTGTKTLFVGAYIDTSPAEAMGLTKGNHVYRSDDEGVSWTHAGSWFGGSTSLAICGGGTSLFGTDTLGMVYLGGASGGPMVSVGVWGANGAKVDCAVGPGGTVYFADAVYCGDPLDEGCAALWFSDDQGSTSTKLGSYGITNAGGNKASITVDDEGNLYAQEGEGDVLGSTDGGVTWALLGTVPSVKSINSVQVSDAGVLYAATAPSAGTSPPNMGGEFYVSMDGGVIWQKGEDWTPGGSGSGWLGMETAHVIPD